MLRRLLLCIPAGKANSTEASCWRAAVQLLCRYVAVLQTNQTTGRQVTSNAAWALGRAYVDPTSTTWQAVFPKNGVEWNTSRLVSPSTFSILGYGGPYLDNQGVPSLLNLALRPVASLFALEGEEGLVY